MLIEIQERTPELIEQLVSLWEGSVKATHHFLSEAEIAAIKPYVPQGLAAIPHLIIAKEGENPTAFMGIAEGKLEMLFVAADQHGIFSPTFQPRFSSATQGASQSQFESSEHLTYGFCG